LFFIGFNVLTGAELWISDGTIVGTTIIKDINPGVNSSDPQGAANGDGFSIVGSTLYFTADDGTNGRELWKTDGTLANTVMVKDMNAIAINFAMPFGTEVIGSTLFFTANVTGSGTELWKTDGTSGGTVMVKEITSGISSTTFSNSFYGNGTYVFFIANDGTNGLELWRTDGTSAGTIMLQNINASGDAFQLNSGGSFDWDGFIFNNVLYFHPNGSISGNQLWKSNGTIVGTSLVTSLSGSNTYMQLYESIIKGTKFYFSAQGSGGVGIYGTDGTAGGTALVKAFTGISSNPKILLHRENIASAWSQGLFAGGRFFVLADDGTNGYELWISDGTTLGTTLVKDINSGSPNAFSTISENRYFYSKYKLFFGATNGTNGTEVWQSDGTTGGTSMVQDLWSGSNSSDPDFFGVAETTNKLIFKANNSDGFDIYALNATVVPFPLSLISFTAELRNNKVALSWITEQEVNVSHFNIERSVTGSEFSTIGRINAGGARTYNFNDEKLDVKSGRLYYRLSIADKDGETFYSKILSVKLKSEFGFSFTNTQSELRINFNEVNGDAVIKLIDINGRLQFQQKTKVASGQPINIPISTLASGMYFINVEYDGQIQTQRFIR
jgi:ELWxxDGT repeat protein